MIVDAQPISPAGKIAMESHYHPPRRAAPMKWLTVTSWFLAALVIPAAVQAQDQVSAQPRQVADQIECQLDQLEWGPQDYAAVIELREVAVTRIDGDRGDGTVSVNLNLPWRQT